MDCLNLSRASRPSTVDHALHPASPHRPQFLSGMKGDSIDQVTQQSLSEIAKQLGDLFNQ